MKTKIKNHIYEQMFNPGILGIFINPFYIARKGLVQHIRKVASQIRGRTLDIGCGTKPYKKFFHSTEYLGLEIDSYENRQKKNADYYYDGTLIPFNDAEFDSVISSQVFEHVFDPDHFLAEIRRVLKPAGVLLLTVPFVWDEHEQPCDFARYSSFGLTYLLKNHGFDIISLEKSVNDIRIIFQMINAYLYKKLITKNNYLNVMIICFFMAPFTLLGELLAFVTPKNNDLYLDNIVLAKKVGD